MEKKDEGKTPAKQLVEQLKAARERVSSHNQASPKGQAPKAVGIMAVVTLAVTNLLEIWEALTEPLTQLAVLENAAKTATPALQAEAKLVADRLRADKVNAYLAAAAELESKQQEGRKALMLALRPIAELEKQALALLAEANDKIKEAQQGNSAAHQKVAGAKAKITKLDKEIRELAEAGANGRSMPKAEAEAAFQTATERLAELEERCDSLRAGVELNVEGAQAYLDLETPKLAVALTTTETAKADLAASTIEDLRKAIAQSEAELHKAQAEAEHARVTIEAIRTEVKPLEEELQEVNRLRSEVSRLRKSWDETYQRRLRLERQATLGVALPEKLPCSLCPGNRKHLLEEMYHPRIDGLRRILRGKKTEGEEVIPPDEVIFNLVKHLESKRPEATKLLVCSRHKSNAAGSGRLLDLILDAPEVLARKEVEYAERHHRPNREQKAQAERAEDATEAWLQVAAENPLDPEAPLGQTLEQIQPQLDELEITLVPKSYLRETRSMGRRIHPLVTRAQELEQRAVAVEASAQAEMARLRKELNQNLAEQALANAKISHASSLEDSATDQEVIGQQVIEQGAAMKRLGHLQKESRRLNAAIHDQQEMVERATAAWAVAVAKVEEAREKAAKTMASEAAFMADQLRKELISELGLSKPKPEEKEEYTKRREKVGPHKAKARTKEAEAAIKAAQKSADDLEKAKADQATADANLAALENRKVIAAAEKEEAEAKRDAAIANRVAAEANLALARLAAETALKATALATADASMKQAAEAAFETAAQAEADALKDLKAAKADVTAAGQVVKDKTAELEKLRGTQPAAAPAK